MLKHAFIFLLLLFLISAPAALYSFDMVNLWRHSEIAGKNSVFVDASVTELEFENFNWTFLPVNFRLDYMLPLPLPFSLGVFMKTPYPNLKNFGCRLAYHVDMDDPFLDIYFVYEFDLGFVRNDVLLEYNDSEVPLNYYDFRIGLRRFFGSFFGFSIETGFKFESVILSLSVKLY